MLGDDQKEIVQEKIKPQSQNQENDEQKAVDNVKERVEHNDPDKVEEHPAKKIEEQPADKVEEHPPEEDDENKMVDVIESTNDVLPKTAKKKVKPS